LVGRLELHVGFDVLLAHCRIHHVEVDSKGLVAV